MHFAMSSAICFNLDLSKILSSVHGLNRDITNCIEDTKAIARPHVSPKTAELKIFFLT